MRYNLYNNDINKQNKFNTLNIKNSLYTDILHFSFPELATNPEHLNEKKEETLMSVEIIFTHFKMFCLEAIAIVQSFKKV